MYFDRITAAPSGARLIVRHGLAATQWEMALAEAGIFGDASAWPSRGLASFGGWLAESWEAARANGDVIPDRCLLSANQTLRLWRRVIDESDEGAALISSAGVAEWARVARRSLFEFGLVPERGGTAGWQGDAAAFGHWNRRFEHRLAENGWIDADSLLYRFNRLSESATTTDLILLDPAPDVPELERLEARCRSAGSVFERIWPDDQRAERRLLIAADPEDELLQAAEWSARVLDRRPDARLAIVIPDLKARHDEAERVFSDCIEVAAISSATSRSIRDVGIFGAALTALRLLAPGADFGTLSRWLRSPFFAATDSDAARRAVSFERELRLDPRAQQDFMEAYRRHGLRHEFQRRLPEMAGKLDACLERLPRLASPTGWVASWQACLKTLGWQGFEATLSRALHDAWDSALAGFSELTPVTGALTMSSALEEFGRVISAQSIYAPLRRTGVHLLSRIEQIGPAYQGAWISGFTDLSWPEPPDPNPLIPWTVRAACGMPGARPEATLVAARKTLDRLFCRVPVAAFSCPDRILDQPQVPNPVFSDWGRPPTPQVTVRRSFGPAARIGARGFESLPDPAPPFESERLPGGTRTLDLQSACPARAFCVARLGAEPLQPPARGLDPRRRGLLVHRALELLFDPSTAEGELTHAESRRLEAAVRAAFAEGMPPGDAGWQVQVAAERARLERLLAGFLELESSRETFRTIAVERRSEIEIGGRRLRCRIDRIDRLSPGEDLLIDYKTGKRSVGGWFNERLGDCQLPVYAQQSRGTVAAIVVATLTDDKAEYRAVGLRADAFPGRQRRFEADAWQRQLERWHDQLTTLVDEFARGDVRVRAEGTGEGDGAYAAVTRIRSLRR
jgi:ATP-dependent helicase/nuclease subunit B